MTSTTLSSKEFKTLFKWAFKRNRAIMIIFSVLMGIGVILDLYIMSFDSSSSDDAIAPVTIAVFECMAAFFTYISALKTFSYLHNKRSVDMFGALPTTRPVMLVSHLLAGIASIAAPFMASSLLVMGITAFSGDYFSDCVFMIFTTLIMIVAGYSFTSLVAHCCGTVVDTAIVTFLSNCIWCGIIALYFGIVTEMIPGTDFEEVVYTPLLTALSPYAFSVMDLFFFEDTNITTVVASVVWQLLFTAGIFVLSIFVAKKRKAESSQNGFAFPWLPMAVKAGASVVSGAFIGFIAAETAYQGFSNMYMFAFWYVIISAVSFFVLHLIFARGLKGRFVPSAIVYGCTTVAAIGIVFIMTTGIGIDTYVPNPSTIKSVEFNYNEFKDPENIQTITEIHQIIADSIRDVEEYPYYLGEEDNYYDDYVYNDYDYDVSAEYDENYKTDETSDDSPSERDYYRYTDYVGSFEFKYNRKVGFKTIRSYYINGSFPGYSVKYYDIPKIDELLEKLYSSEEYKRSCIPEIFDEKEREGFSVSQASLSYYQVDSSGYNSSYLHNKNLIETAELPTDDAFMNGLYEVLQKDILADNHFFYGTNYMSYDINPGDVVISLSVEFKKFDRGSYNNVIPIYVTIKNSYKNTLDYFDKNNIEKKTIDIDNNDVFDSDYVLFAQTADISYMHKYVETSAKFLLKNACFRYEGSLSSEWEDEHYDDYLEKLLDRTSKAYSEIYKNDDYYFSMVYEPDYENYYTRQTENYPEYIQLADLIMDDLEEFSDNYVNENAPSDSDSEVNSETETDSESSSDSKSEDSDSDSSKSSDSKASDSEDLNTEVTSGEMI